MKFEESIYFNKKAHYKVDFPFGRYYLFENYFIAELARGIHFDWKKIKEVSNFLVAFYGKQKKIGHITNRVNHYSINPNHWQRFNQEFGFIVASAIVVYNHMGFMNATLEKQFSQNAIKRCASLHEAIYWMERLKEFKM
ncbi:hypothetical protein ACFSQP_10900 [Bizionia sediminis]|uniref:STAS/SEC14 domain-containing protein n=1 Tax=Bizionia sediminis TaxID=1737064 RepID=A0ABW5KWM3_9FLAO